MVDQKWKWIADLMNCADGNSFSVKKIKLNWFGLKKFVSKKKTVTLTTKSSQRQAMVHAKW